MDTPPTAMVALLRALVAARQGTPPVIEKTSQVEELGYSVIGHEHVLVTCRGALLQQGLVLEQTGVRLAETFVYSTSRGERTGLYWLATYRLAHVDGAEREYTFAITTAAAEKAGSIAGTGLDRIAHMRVLQLAGAATEPRDSEIDEHGEFRPRSSAQRPPNRAQRAGSYSTRQQSAGDPRPQRQSRVDNDARLQESLRELIEHALPESRTFDSLAEVGRELQRLIGTVDERRPAWAAFMERCAALKLEWRKVLGARPPPRVLDDGANGRDVGSRFD